jgi:hypothetical protein
MSSPQCIKVKHGSEERTIALYSGLGTDELVNLLKATFNVFDSTVVGFLTEVRCIVIFEIAQLGPFLFFALFVDITNIEWHCDSSFDGHEIP